LRSEPIAATIPGVIDLSAEGPPRAGRRRLRRRLWLVVGVIGVLSCGSIAAVAVSMHYAHARPLEMGGTGGWAAPDNLRSRLTQVDGRSELFAPVRRGQDQSFVVEVHNASGVTQTILGLPYRADGIITADVEHVAVSRGEIYGTGLTVDQLEYASPPVSLPPGGSGFVRFTIRVGGCWPAGKSEFWTGLPLRVRVGAFTRTETVDLTGSTFVLTSTAPTC
jgi:hypothetical protein